MRVYHRVGPRCIQCLRRSCSRQPPHGSTAQSLKSMQVLLEPKKELRPLWFTIYKGKDRGESKRERIKGEPFWEAEAVLFACFSEVVAAPDWCLGKGGRCALHCAPGERDYGPCFPDEPLMCCAH